MVPQQSTSRNTSRNTSEGEKQAARARYRSSACDILYAQRRGEEERRGDETTSPNQGERSTEDDTDQAGGKA